MGTSARVVLYGDDESAAREAGRAALDEVTRIERVLSDHDARSELNALLARAGEKDPVPVSADLYQAISLALEFARRTEGAFDPTVGPYVALWREAAATGTRPSAEALAGARQRVGWRRVELHPPKRAVRLPVAGMRLDFGAIGKGFAAQAAWAVLGTRAHARCLVDVGGDVVVGAPPPGKAGWRVALDDGPTLSLAHAAVATSGDTEQFVEIDGVRYSHIVDPKTGSGLTHRLRVTVVAGDGVMADVFATAVSVVGKEQGLARIEGTDGAEVLIRSADGTTAQSKGFARYVAD